MAFKMKGFSPFHQEKTGSRTLRKAKLITPRKPTYREAWANMSEEEKAKYGSYEAFETAAIKYNKPGRRLMAETTMTSPLEQGTETKTYTCAICGGTRAQHFTAAGAPRDHKYKMTTAEEKATK